MKYPMLRRTAALLLVLLLSLSLAACGSGQGSGGSQGSFGKKEPPQTDQTDPNDPGTDDPAPDDPTPDQPTPGIPGADQPSFTFSAEAQQSLEELRSHGRQELFAAAILAEREAGDSSSLTALLNNSFPGFSTRWPFAQEIPEAHTVGDHGALYCIVPLDGQVTLTVRQVTWKTLGNGAEPTLGDTLYLSDTDQPFLLYVTHGDWPNETDVCIEVSGGGPTWTWYPTYEEGAISSPLDENDRSQILDFTFLNDFFNPPFVPDSEWLTPLAAGIGNTTWYGGNNWRMDLGYDENAANGSGGVVIYEPLADEDGVYHSRYAQGTWWIEDGCLQLDVYNNRGEMVGGAFPLWLAPSGEQLLIRRAADGTLPPFFAEGQVSGDLYMALG